MDEQMDEREKNTVLIVDDETLVIAALTQILGQEYTVLAAKDGREAIEKAEKFVPDIILLDIVMPEPDGYAVIAALKNSEKTRDIPVIFISGLSDASDEGRGLAAGAADYIQKPIVPEIARLRVSNQIKIINQTRQIIEKELAEKSSRVKMDFMLQMSHDMFTPMNVIIGMARIASRELNPATTAECLEEIENASQVLLNQIKELLNLR